MRKFLVTLMDSDNAFVVAVPAESEEKAVEYVNGNGEVRTVDDVTEEVTIRVDDVVSALESHGFGKIQIDFISRTLVDQGICY